MRDPIRAREWKLANRERANAQAQARYAANPERVKRAQEKYRVKNPDKIKKLQREAFLRWQSEMVDDDFLLAADVVEVHAFRRERLPAFGARARLQAIHIKTTGSARFREELAKCDLVCSNCHRIRTRRRANAEASCES